MKRLLKLSTGRTEIVSPRTLRAVRGLSGGMIVAVAIVGMDSPQSVAQTAATGGIAGIVTDATGAIVNNAKITVTSESTGESHPGTSTSNGSFIVPLLPPGSYTVRASKEGFKELVHTGVTVHVTETAAALANEAETKLA